MPGVVISPHVRDLVVARKRMDAKGIGTAVCPAAERALVDLVDAIDAMEDRDRAPAVEQNAVFVERMENELCRPGGDPVLGDCDRLVSLARLGAHLINEMTEAAISVLAERRRQVEAEGWLPEHDDQHLCGEMAVAAAAYVLHDIRGGFFARWPWESRWWKPGDRRRNLVKAGALILAEIERLDRAAGARISRDADPRARTSDFAKEAGR